MTADNVREMLLIQCNALGSRRAWARKYKVSAAYVSDVILGKRAPGPSICKPMGIECNEVYSVSYRKIKR